MSHICIGVELHFVTFINVAKRIAAAIPIVGPNEIPELIGETFNNFRENYGRKPKLFVSDNVA